MDESPLPRLSEDDPQCLLSNAARMRIQHAYAESELIRRRAMANAAFASRAANEPIEEYIARSQVPRGQESKYPRCDSDDVEG